jgi:hypothetical protein
MRVMRDDVLASINRDDTVILDHRSRVDEALRAAMVSDKTRT